MREFNDIDPALSLYIKNKIRDKVPGISKRIPEPLVEIICYSLLPNHFHFILRQLKDGGISKFMLKLGMGYANYFNFKYLRSGSLFQGRFKAIHIKTNSYFFWLSGYINGNAEIHKICKTEKWSWSSYKDYLNLRRGTLCDKGIILKDFKNIEEYKNLVNIIVKESTEIKNAIKQYLLE